MLKAEIDLSKMGKILSIGELNKRKDKFIKENTLLLENLCKQECPVDTGRMQGSISSLVSTDQGTVAAHVNYAKYVINGTYKQSPNAYNTRAVNNWRSKVIK